MKKAIVARSSVQCSVETDIHLAIFKKPVLHCFIKNLKLGYIRYSILKKCKKGPRRNYTYRKPKLLAKFKFKETSEAPVSRFIYNWRDAVSTGPIAEIGSMSGEN